jgi:uncharacterized peroxidase-related enzyme
MSPTPESHLPLIDPATVTDPTVRAVYDEIERELGFGIVPNVFRAMGGQPAVLRAAWDLFRATVLQGLLPRTVKEMIGIVVSAANDSQYALTVHLHSLGVQGISDDVLAQLAAGADGAPGLAPSVAAIIAVAHTAARRGPLAVSDADIARLEAEGVSRSEWAEVIATIDLFRYINGFTDLAHVPIDAI